MAIVYMLHGSNGHASIAPTDYLGWWMLFDVECFWLVPGTFDPGD